MLTLFLLAAIPGAGSAWSAEPVAGVIVAGSGAPVTVSMAALDALPQTTVTTTLTGAHGAHTSTFVGPLLFTMLDHLHAVDAGQMRSLSSQTVLVTGSDGYSAVLAIGEIAPGLENKTVILAERQDGKALGPDHLRLVVPGDAHASRSVHDVVRLTVR